METKAEIYTQIYNKTLDFISYSQRTQREIEQKLDKLLAKQESTEDNALTNEQLAEIRTEVIQALTEEGHVDDVKYANLYTQQQMTAKNPSSKLEIGQFLYKKGVAREVADEALVNYTREIELKNIKAIAEKNKHKAHEKVLQYLLRRGFTADTVFALKRAEF